ncbi:hypothetical protein GGR57DRAFT_508423 [Xylariaceae sp. FL1272]|nr:hypothetical protein GGR57DRAFT_508423 [Xylariaceae sp. FL1272]
MTQSFDYDSDYEHDHLLSEKSFIMNATPEPHNRHRLLNRFSIAVGLLLASAILNIALLLQAVKPDVDENPPTKYAQMRRTREEPYVVVTQYDSRNQTLQDQLWHDINLDAAYVALPDDYVDEHELRRAQRFPWDTSKGLYLLHGYHNLHCVKIVYLALAEYRRGDTQTRDWRHLSHCLDSLRRQVICDADDTPRATERRPEIISGVYQHRMCRRWEDLEAYARKYTACYQRPENPDADTRPIIDRFKHCPPGVDYVFNEDYVATDPYVEGLPEESVEESVELV